MKKVKSFLMGVQNRFMMRVAGVRNEVERGDHLLEVLGTIIIAVVILVMFREKLTNLFSDALNKTTNQVTEMFGNMTEG